MSVFFVVDLSWVSLFTLRCCNDFCVFFLFLIWHGFLCFLPEFVWISSVMDFAWIAELLIDLAWISDMFCVGCRIDFCCFFVL